MQSSSFVLIVRHVVYRIVPVDALMLNETLGASE